MEELKQVVREIISNNIPEGVFFDAHAVIAKMLQDGNYGKYMSSGQDEATFDGLISRIIRDSDLAVDQKEDTWSKNLRDKFSLNRLYKRETKKKQN